MTEIIKAAVTASVCVICISISGMGCLGWMPALTVPRSTHVPPPPPMPCPSPLVIRSGQQELLSELMWALMVTIVTWKSIHQSCCCPAGGIKGARGYWREHAHGSDCLLGQFSPRSFHSVRHISAMQSASIAIHQRMAHFVLLSNTCSV